MYSRDFGGIKSDGQLYELEREYNGSMRRESCGGSEEKESDCPEKAEGPHKPDKKERIKPELDDLLLIGIAILLLTDSDEDNDILLLVIAFLLFF